MRICNGDMSFETAGIMIMISMLSVENKKAFKILRILKAFVLSVLIFANHGHPDH